MVSITIHKVKSVQNSKSKKEYSKWLNEYYYTSEIIIEQKDGTNIKIDLFSNTKF